MIEPVFQPPPLTDLDHEVLGLIEELRVQLRYRVAEPRRWTANLRRMTLAHSVQGSNSIEGYLATLDDVAAAVDDEPTLSASEETEQALHGYRDAMTYVLQVAQDPSATIDASLLKALHFMMLRHDLAMRPGRWRAGFVGVHDERSGELVYHAPDAERVPALIDAMLDRLSGDDQPPLVRAAMTHLNLVMIHPFRDGNGRMARCLQTLVLAREQIVTPVLSSIEEELGRDARAYYDVLAEVGQGRWRPERSTRPWLRFCLTAHYRQAKTHLRRVNETEHLWIACADLVEQRRLPERATGPLLDAASGLRIRNPSYRATVEMTAAEEISELTASRELKALVDAGLLRPVGANRARYYLAAPPLTALRDAIRATRPPREAFDPFAVARAHDRAHL
ncbi:Fic family protein [Conexibacter sp. JD483]|uniref:Fic family protein n=1 Tax=unclassified Conexibacter TaxID=2627773 RepID=UPI0027225765|nr:MULTISPECIES: Fic family protein [unclassified Conexibacter]MDO8186226.1 Fic family protein [Conexibacter sp. CPCC 205706]MDO8199707.1 Fic family protein [Conexibacter sp. CPCC 205762]MDR9368201.1 Fic family protein [Conexibacter sp. JD483]